MKMAIAIGEPDRYVQGRIVDLRKNFPEVEISVFGNNERDFSGIDVLLARNLSQDELARSESLHTLFVPYTGLNRFPLGALKDRGVTVINSHGKAQAVAERALALALSVMGRIIEMHVAMQQEGVWLTRKRWGEEYWRSMYNKRCGIYGMGAIGHSLIRLLRPFGVTIVGLERDRHKDLADAYVPDLRGLAKACDVLFVCVPLSEHTSGSIDRDVLALMRGKFIINIARGEVIQEDALHWALKEGGLAGAGIDVWYHYPEVGSYEPTFPSRYPVHELKNLVMSPHAASHAIEFRNGYYEDTFNQIEHFLAHGKALRHVDLDKHITS